MSGNPVVKLKQQANYQFSIYYNEEKSPIMGDEPPPLGKSEGATLSQLLIAAVANCLSDSLLFALRKFKQNPDPIETIATCEIGRNDQNHLRILSIRVGVPEESLENLDRILVQFQEFCTVSSSVSAGIPVNVFVIDSLKKQLYT